MKDKKKLCQGGERRRKWDNDIEEDWKDKRKRTEEEKNIGRKKKQ